VIDLLVWSLEDCSLGPLGVIRHGQWLQMPAEIKGRPWCIVWSPKEERDHVKVKWMVGVTSYEDE